MLLSLAPSVEIHLSNDTLYEWRRGGGKCDKPFIKDLSHQRLKTKTTKGMRTKTFSISVNSAEWEALPPSTPVRLKCISFSKAAIKEINKCLFQLIFRLVCIKQDQQRFLQIGRQINLATKGKHECI